MTQLTEVMGQKSDETFINLLNSIRVNECSEDIMKQIQLRKIDFNSVPLDANRIFAENKLKNE